MQTLLDLIRIIGEIYITIVLLRFILQACRADFYNPISQFITKATNPLLFPLRHVIPGWKGLDFASLVLALILQFLLECIINTVPLNLILPHFGQLLAISLIALISSAIQLYTFALFIIVIISWIAPGSYHPGAMLLYQITEPLLKPIRNILPTTGGLDFSPMLLLLILFVLRQVVTGAY